MNYADNMSRVDKMRCFFCQLAVGELEKMRQAKDAVIEGPKQAGKIIVQMSLSLRTCSDKSKGGPTTT